MKENITINGNVTVNGGITVNGNLTIGSESTLREIIQKLGNVEKLEKKPKWVQLREMAGEPVAQSEDGSALVYSNGYAVYDNGSGKTVLWLKDCTEFTYYFDSDPSDAIPNKSTMGEDILGGEPWYIAVMLCGDHQIDGNMMNRTGSRKGTKEELADEHGDRARKVDGEVSRMLDIPDFGNPEAAYIRKEAVKEKMKRLTEKQRRVFLLYHWQGYTQEEIGKMLGISQPGVVKHLALAESKMGF